MDGGDDIGQVSWRGLDLDRISSVFPSAERVEPLEESFKPGTCVYAFPDAYGKAAIALTYEDNKLRSYGPHALSSDTLSALQAAGAVFL